MGALFLEIVFVQKVNMYVCVFVCVFMYTPTVYKYILQNMMTIIIRSDLYQGK